jgi:hypothetical protein
MGFLEGQGYPTCMAQTKRKTKVFKQIVFCLSLLFIFNEAAEPLLLAFPFNGASSSPCTTIEFVLDLFCGPLLTETREH